MWWVAGGCRDGSRRGLCKATKAGAEADMFIIIYAAGLFTTTNLFASNRNDD